MLWEFVALVSSLGVFWLGKKVKILILGEFIIGVLWGVFWELAMSEYFLYKGFLLYIGEVPLAILVLWGVVVAGFVLLSNLIRTCFNIKGLIWQAICDILVTGCLGTLFEYLGSHQLDMWTYPAGTELHPLLDVPWNCVAGWWIIGLFVMAVARLYDKIFEHVDKP